VAFGYALFGVGVEYAGITVSKSVVKWFKGKELALAMGMQVAIARLGSFVPLAFGAKAEKMWDVPTVIFVGVLILMVGLLFFLYYNIKDKQLDNQINENILDAEVDKFKIRDLGLIISNRGFWLIAILCVLFYSAVFPFYKYGPDLMVNKFGVSAEWAGWLPSLVPVGTMLLTPLFGSIYDKRGKGASIMILGAVLLIIVHIVFFLPGINSVFVAFFNVILLGIAFSLVPSAMWPSVPKIIPEKQLGSAYALIFWIQNMGLWGIPLAVGIVLNATNPTIVPDKTLVKDAFAKAYIEVVENTSFVGMEDEIGKTIEMDDLKRYARSIGGELTDKVVKEAPQEEVADLDSNQLFDLIYIQSKDAMMQYYNMLDEKSITKRNDDNELVEMKKLADKGMNEAF
ncbi:MAG: MFS transporter, partial [Bacteroidales bacterium]|nr:MFS transporter [Bacteroidales bacterium]